MPKELYASLELSEKEVRVLVSECFNTRFNILQVVRIPCNGLKNFRITDREEIVRAIKEAKKEVLNKIGSDLHKAILLIPPVNFKRIALETEIIPDEKGLSRDDVLRALNKTLEIEIDPDLLVINRVPVSYTINGITSKRIPYKEISDSARIEIDLLCADKNLTFDYVSLVEESGIEVIDICLSNYAICKEASLFEQSTNRNIILLDINDNYTNMSLIVKGKMMTCEVIEKGIESFAKDLYEKYSIPFVKMSRLIKYNGSRDIESKDTVYAYNRNKGNVNISLSELNTAILPYVKDYLDNIAEMSKPVIESKETFFAVVSEGSDMLLIADILKEKTGCEIKMIHPDSIGVREANLISLYGSLFAAKEMIDISQKNVCCLDEFEFNNVVDRKIFEDEGETFTTKIRTFFKQYMDKEND